MTIQTQIRQKGDLRIALAVTLKRPGVGGAVATVVDLTSLTLNFRMCTALGVDKVAQTASNVTVTDATAGQVKYTFQADDVDTEGVFHAYFIITDSGDDTFPARAGDLQVDIQDCA